MAKGRMPEVKQLIYNLPSCDLPYILPSAFKFDPVYLVKS
jgi:hypothetical protein